MQSMKEKKNCENLPVVQIESFRLGNKINILVIWVWKTDSINILIKNKKLKIGIPQRQKKYFKLQLTKLRVQIKFYLNALNYI